MTLYFFTFTFYFSLTDDKQLEIAKVGGRGRRRGGWALAIAVMGAVAVFSGKLNEGRVASRIVAAILANAEESGKVAVVSDGGLDELFFFMLPEKVKLISLAREREPEYGRELSEWVKDEVKVKGEGEQRNLSSCSADQHTKESNPPLFTFTSDLHLGQVEDLAWRDQLRLSHSRKKGLAKRYSPSNV